DGLVRVTLQEVDDHLLANARNRNPAPVLARPRAGDTDPAARVLIFLALTFPVELHLDPAVLVAVDLLAAGPDHHRGLRAAHRGPWRRPPRTELLLFLEH